MAIVGDVAPLLYQSAAFPDLYGHNWFELRRFVRPEVCTGASGVMIRFGSFASLASRFALMSTAIAPIAFSCLLSLLPSPALSA